MLFFMLSGYLLADTFWREEKADLRVYAIRRFFRIAPAYYVCLTVLFLFFASTRLTFSEQGGKQILANAHLHALPVPRHVELAQRQRRAVDADHRDAALRLPAADGAGGALQARGSATLVLIAIGLGWRARVAYDGDWLRDFYFGATPVRPGHREPVHRPAVHRGGLDLRPGHPGQVARGARSPGPDLRAAAGPARRQLVPAAVLPSIALLYWVEQGIELHQPPAVHGLRLRAHGGPGARPAAGSPAAVSSRPARCGPCRPGWASAATASTSGTSRSSWPSTSGARSSACRPRTATGGGSR